MTIRGFIDYRDEFQIRGWAWDSSLPESRLGIEIHSDGILTGRCIADLYREDLKTAGVGDGCHGFVVRYDEAAKVIKFPSDFRCYAVSANETRELLEIDAASYSGPPLVPPTSRKQIAQNFGVQRPVFVLGAARSGTTAMAAALRNGAKFAGHGEGHILGLLPTFHMTLHRYYEANGEELIRETTIARVPSLYFRERINSMFRDLMVTVYPCERWVDKTPSAALIQSIPYLRTVWPEARFIFMKRSGIDNIISRERKFKTVSFEEHCQDWANVMRQWAEFKHFCGDKALEVDQWEMSNDARTIANRVSRFLGLESLEANKFAGVLENDHPEQTSGEWGRRRLLSETGWSEEQQNIFVDICGPTMIYNGYSIL
jgi:hypothetical protein